jgi:hypothetical protein
MALVVAAVTGTFLVRLLRPTLPRDGATVAHVLPSSHE